MCTRRKKQRKREATKAKSFIKQFCHHQRDRPCTHNRCQQRLWHSLVTVNEVWNAIEWVPKLKVSFYKFSPLFSRFLIYTSVNKWLILYLHLKTPKHCHFSFGALRKRFNDIFHILMMFSLFDRHLFFLPPFFSLI